MQFEYDPERLIEEVKKRPGIWNYDGTEYKTKNTRHQLWSEVVKELMQNDCKVSKSEMRELEIQLQKKWKSIRDCFRKYILHPKRTRRPYIYSKHLQFLLKTRWNPQKDSEEVENSSDTDESANKSKVNKWTRKLTVKLTKDEEESSDEDNSNAADNQDCSIDNISVDIEPTPTPPPSKISKVKQPVQLDEFAFANVDAQPKVETDDTDKMFLLSLLPHLKSIPEENRLNVKMELMQVLQTAHYNLAQYKMM